MRSLCFPSHTHHCPAINRSSVVTTGWIIMIACHCSVKVIWERTRAQPSWRSTPCEFSGNQDALAAPIFWHSPQFFTCFFLSLYQSIGVQLYSKSPATGGGKNRWRHPPFFFSFIIPSFLPSLPHSPQRKSSQKNAGAWKQKGVDGTKAFLFNSPPLLWSVDFVWWMGGTAVGHCDVPAAWKFMCVGRWYLFLLCCADNPLAVWSWILYRDCLSLLANTRSCCSVCVWFPILCVSLKPLVPVRPGPSGLLGGCYACVWRLCTQLNIATCPVSEVRILALGKSHTLSDFSKLQSPRSSQTMLLSHISGVIQLYFLCYRFFNQNLCFPLMFSLKFNHSCDGRANSIMVVLS